MRRRLIITLALVAGLVAGCDENEEPSAVPTDRPAPDEAAWKETREVASDDEKSIVERIDALEQFAAAARHSRHAPEARKWAAVLEAKRQLNGTYLASIDELDDLHARAATRKALSSGSLLDVAEAVLYYGCIRGATHGRSDRNPIEPPVPFRGLAGENLPVSYRLDYGLGSLRIDVATVVALLPDAPEAATENRWSRAAQNAAINFLAQRHVGGDLVEEPGRWNRRNVRKLLREFEANLEEEVLGVALEKAYPVFSHRAEQTAAVYQTLDEIGRASVLRAYRKAAKKHRTEDGTTGRGMIQFYQKWTADNDIAERSDLEYEYGAWIATSFWMRRMADRTDQMLYATLSKLLKRAEP